MASLSDPSDNVVIDVDANLGNVKIPPPAAISNRTNSLAYPKSVKSDTRPYGSKSPNRAKKDEFQNKSKQRVSSRSPNRVDRDRSRGRSKEKDSTRTKGRSSSFAAEVEVLQYYSVLSKSPSRIDSTPKPVPSVYRRQMTPNTMKYFRDTLFFPTTAEKFKSVWLEKRCLRCFSQEHRAVACPVYTSPTPNVCKFCHYLYHNPDKCIYFDGSGKSLKRTACRGVGGTKCFSFILMTM